MSRIDRYLIRHVLEMTGLVALILVSIYTFVVFVSGIGQVGGAQGGIGEVLEYAVLLVPANTYILLPLIALLGALLAVGDLAHQNELTAIRGAGVSWWRLTASVVIAGIALGILGFALGNWLAPAGQRGAEALKRGPAAGAGQVRWLRNANDVIRIDRLRNANEVDGITIYELKPDQRLATIIVADRAQYVAGAWHLHDVQRTDFHSDGVMVQHSADFIWQGHLTPRVLRLFILEDNALSAPGLVRLISYLHANQLSAAKYEMLLWRKLVEPFTLIAMVLLAVPFAAAPRLRQAGFGQRLLAGIVIGIIFYIVDKVAVSLGSVYGWSPSLSAATPTVALALVAFWALRRVR